MLINSILSGNGVSGNPGAVHCEPPAGPCSLWAIEPTGRGQLAHRTRGVYYTSINSDCQTRFDQIKCPVPLPRVEEFEVATGDLWAYHHHARIDFSRPGKPTDNCFVETFNGSFRDECLNLHWFESMEEAKVTIEAWRRGYNESRPHMTLGDAAPFEFAWQLGARAQLPSALAVEK